MPAGDHVVLVAEVAAIARRPALPLVYAQRAFGTHSGLKEQEAEPAGTGRAAGTVRADSCYA
jgi:hypothetical protein